MNQAATLPFKNFFPSIIQCKSNSLEYYQFLSAMPSFMFKKVGEMDNTSVEGFAQGAPSFMLDENIVLNLEKLKCRYFYRLLISKLHQSTPAGLQRWSKILPIDIGVKYFQLTLGRIFKTCKETKLREFKFKLLHRIVVTKKELKRFGIKSESDCACIAVNQIPYTTLFLTANSPRLLLVKWWGGLMPQIILASIQNLRK